MSMGGFFSIHSLQNSTLARALL